MEDLLDKLLAQLWFQNLIAVAGFAIALTPIILSARSERWVRAWRRLRADRIGSISGLVICVFLFVGALEMIHLPAGPGGAGISLIDWLGRGVPLEKTYSAPFATTSFSEAKPTPLRGPHSHLLGTDALGKDTFLQMLKACRTALVIGGLTSLIYIPLGTLLGILAGYFRGLADDVIQFTYSVVTSVPEILLLISFLMVRGKGLGNMSLALGITGWVGLCRLIRGETMRQAERPYVSAARALGQTHWQIVTRHLLPNVMHLVLINFVLGFSGLVLAEAILSYLGVGAPVGTASWGVMIDGARAELSREPVVWWNISAATFALFCLVLSLNLFGDALRRAFDPRRG